MRVVVLVLATLAAISKFHGLDSKLHPEDSTKRHYMLNMRNLNQIKHAGLICMCNMRLVFDQNRKLHGSSKVWVCLDREDHRPGLGVGDADIEIPRLR